MTTRARDLFPPLVEPDPINPADIKDLGNVVFFGDIRSVKWDGAGNLDTGADPNATQGYFIDTTSGRAQFQEIFAFGGSFTDVTVEGDFKAAAWNGADPANLTTTHDAVATAGFYFDSSAGAAQFEGDVYLGGNLKFIAAAGILDFGDGFDMRVYKDNPAVGEDSLWIRGNTNATDHVVIGPASGSQWFKEIRLRANSIEFETSTLTHNWPKGLLYDWQSNVDATGSVGTTESTKQTLVMSVPNGVPVTVFAWATARFENSGDHRWVALRTTIGAAAQHLPMLEENDLTTSTSAVASSGSTGAGTSHSHGINSGAWNTQITDAHFHASPSGAQSTNTEASHTHSLNSHTHSHDHTLGNQWRSLASHQMRSFTPSGTTVDVDLNMWVESGSQTIDESVLLAIVVVN